jgi:hypothetical protein
MSFIFGAPNVSSLAVADRPDSTTTNATMPSTFPSNVFSFADSKTTNATKAEEENAIPNDTKKRKSNNHRPSGNEEKTGKRKSERTPKKRARYVPHQHGMEVPVDAAMELMARTAVDDEGEKVDFKDVTHRVTSGEFESYEGFMTSKDKTRVTLRLMKNRNGHKMKSALTSTSEKTEVRELDSYDMLAFINTKTAGEEDEALIQYEQQRWECPKCQHSNSNDAGYCSKMVEGKRCGGTKQCEKKSWTGCFQVCDLFFSFFVTSSILRKLTHVHWCSFQGPTDLGMQRVHHTKSY